jgi:cellulose synthase/poly-beta-1,6-N-acetylglucosamine synthase-like glycosyltransferase
MRYLLNKDVYTYENKLASDVVSMIARDYQLKTGTIERTSFLIPSRTEDNETLFDMIHNALDLELLNRKHMYILYDDAGNLTLKALDNMKLGVVIDEDTGENFDYTSSIDDETYNRVKLVFDNDKTGKREVYVQQHGENINRWGILQYFDTIKEGENGAQKAAALLSLYNAKTRKLKINNALGDVRVRAGSLLVVKLNLGDINVNNFMLVEKCTHKFKESEHFMDLTMRGGEFVA